MQPIIDYENEYCITPVGEIYRVNVVNSLKPSINPQNGYLYISLWKNGKGKTFSVHRLVALHFIPNKENKPFVNHIDSNRQNAHVDNLEWCTQSENIQHGYDFGFMSQDSKRRYSIYELELCLTSFLSGVTLTELAKTINCGLANLSRDVRKTAVRLDVLKEYVAELKQQKNLRNSIAAAQKRMSINMHTLDGVYLKTFSSLSEAAQYLGKKSSGTISNALNPLKEQKKGYGYLWTYV